MDENLHKVVWKSFIFIDIILFEYSNHKLSSYLHTNINIMMNDD